MVIAMIILYLLIAVEKSLIGSFMRANTMIAHGWLNSLEVLSLVIFLHFRPFSSARPTFYFGTACAFSVLFGLSWPWFVFRKLRFCQLSWPADKEIARRRTAKWEGRVLFLSFSCSFIHIFFQIFQDWIDVFVAACDSAEWNSPFATHCTHRSPKLFAFLSWRSRARAFESTNITAFEVQASLSHATAVL